MRTAKIITIHKNTMLSLLCQFSVVSAAASGSSCAGAREMSSPLSLFTVTVGSSSIEESPNTRRKIVCGAEKCWFARCVELSAGFDKIFLLQNVYGIA